MLSHLLNMTEILIIDKAHNQDIISVQSKGNKVILEEARLDIENNREGDDEMLLEGGSMDIAIMNQLYREPIRENALRERVGQQSWLEALNAIGRLLRKALVENIQKDSAEPIYKLTRKGERVLERIIVQRHYGRSAA